MNSPSSPVAGAKSLNEELEAEISKLVEQETAKRPLEVKPDAERKGPPLHGEPQLRLRDLKD